MYLPKTPAEQRQKLITLKVTFRKTRKSRNNDNNNIVLKNYQCAAI